MMASFLTNPMDVIKTRLQTQHHSSSLGKLDKEAMKLEAEKLGGGLEVEGSEVLRDAKYRDIRHAIKQIYRTEGIFGFYKGVLPRVLFVSPGVAISWGTYEIFKSLLIRDSS
uniref:Mitochondrial carrier protein n=1 Tax=Euplotes crassus TaxID=5936 RepID=A0A7S3KN17_EUPCR|mmetsp:Transcript_35331/g.34997  ORF Transcript_35331/g.34997 Transcript_35331/m.34997 type:complete len:112 (+) Transcript_35331:659-994(+)